MLDVGSSSVTLQDQLQSIADQLAVIANNERIGSSANETTGAQPLTSSPSFADPDVLVEMAKAIYRARESRHRHFPRDLFGEPAWDILLDLYIAKSRGEMVTVSGACIASQIPPTTALRWIKTLEKDGWIVREDDQIDRRRSFVRLSSKGETAVVRCLIDSHRTIRPFNAALRHFQQYDLNSNN